MGASHAAAQKGVSPNARYSRAAPATAAAMRPARVSNRRFMRGTSIVYVCCGVWQDNGLSQMKFIRFEYRQQRHVGVLTNNGIAPVQSIDPQIPNDLLAIIQTGAAAGIRVGDGIGTV